SPSGGSFSTIPTGRPAPAASSDGITMTFRPPFAGACRGAQPGRTNGAASLIRTLCPRSVAVAAAIARHHCHAAGRISLDYLRRHPAIHGQDNAGNVFRLVRGEEHRGHGDVPGVAHPAHGTGLVAP